MSNDMDERALMELIRGAKSVPGLLEALHKTDTIPVMYDWAVRYYLSMKARERGIPFSGTFELTPLCNLNCKMCYVHLNAQQLGGRELMSADKWESLMQQAVDAGMMYASFTGGECLTYPDFDRLFLFLQDRGVQISILSNGILLDEERIEFFKKHPLTLIQVTLYGADEDTYEKVTGSRQFSRVVANIRAADKAGLPIILSITPNEYMSREDDEKLLRFAATLGVPYHINSMLITPRSDTGRDEGFRDICPEDYMRLFRIEMELNGKQAPLECMDELPDTGGKQTGDIPKGLRCGAGRSGFNISWNGVMHPCSSLLNISAYPFKCGFNKAWSKVNNEANEYLLPIECENCEYKNAARTCAAANNNSECGHVDNEQCKWCHTKVKNGFAKLAGR